MSKIKYLNWHKCLRPAIGVLSDTPVKIQYLNIVKKVKIKKNKYLNSPFAILLKLNN